MVPTGTEIAYPGEAENFHYEAELVVAIGKGGRFIPSGEAAGHIYGYATGLDMTRRDLQLVAREKGRPWDIGKNVEQSSPIGLIHPIAKTGEITGGSIRLTVNGDVKQDADLEEGLDACEALIAGQDGPFCFGETVTPADVCLVAQMGNARRFGADLRWPRLLAAEAACNRIAAFERAAPQNQPYAF